MKIDISFLRRNTEAHDWFAWYPVTDVDDEFGLLWMETVRRKWLPPQCPEHYGNYVHRRLTPNPNKR